jgi:uncharacterized protein (TIGR03083 family)
VEPVGPIETAPLLAPLHAELMRLLRGLTPLDWDRPTIAGDWKVRDVAAHLLDSSLRRLSVQRDGHILTPEHPIDGYRDLVGFLNALNADWVRVARRFSPPVLMDLLDVSGPAVAGLLASLPPHGPAIFSVAWAGEEASENWFDVGREYTEWWHHQAQIREAVGAPPIASRRFLHPVLELSLYGVPVALRGAAAGEGSALAVRIEGEAGGVWSLVRTGPDWKLWRGEASAPPALTVRMDTDTAWRLFFNALPREEARSKISLAGDPELARRFVESRGVMV